MKRSDMDFWIHGEAGGTKIFSAKKLSEAVYNTLLHYEEQATEASARASMTREEVAQEIQNKWDEENMRLRKRLKFSIIELHSQKEYDAYKAFVENHRQCKGSGIGHGGTPYVTQYGTGLGTGTIVCCPVCHEEEDISDTSCW